MDEFHLSNLVFVDTTELIFWKYELNECIAAKKLALTKKLQSFFIPWGLFLAR